MLVPSAMYMVLSAAIARPGKWNKHQQFENIFQSKRHIFDLNPLPVQFKAVLHGQKGCVFFSGHLNLPTTPEIGLPSREKNHNN